VRGKMTAMEENPYRSPSEFRDAGHSGAIDRSARDELRQAVDDFCADRMTAFAFDERLSEIRDQTSDQTAQFVIDQLWYHYDDCQDHLVALQKPEWDAIQRLLLVLESGAELQSPTRRTWHLSQAVAAVVFLITGYTCSFFDWNAWPFFFIPGGIVSIALSNWRARKLMSLVDPDPWHAAPFPSIGSIGRALTRAPSFHKQKFRSAVGERRIRSRMSDFRVQCQTCVFWCLASPIVLLAQCLPLRILRLMLIERQKQAVEAA
jgi:hypothetical protein